MFFEQVGRHGSSEFRMHAETAEAHQEQKEKEPTEYLQMIGALREAIQDYFPEDASQFHPPSFSRFLESFESSLISIHQHLGEGDKIQVDEQDPAFIAAAAIRFVDDFLDETLWPKRSEYTPAIFEKLVKGFLERAYAIANVYDPALSHDIIKLPLIELQLEMHPTQENFDNQIQTLFYQKSYDMAYVAHRFFDKQGEKPFSPDQQENYLGVVIADYARDFSLSAVDRDKDFNVFRYIRENKLGTFMLEQLVLKYLQSVDRELGKQAERLMKGDEPFSPDDLYSYKAKSPELFSRGMLILSALWKWRYSHEKNAWDDEEKHYDLGDVI